MKKSIVSKSAIKHSLFCARARWHLWQQNSLAEEEHSYAENGRGSSTEQSYPSEACGPAGKFHCSSPWISFDSQRHLFNMCSQHWVVEMRNEHEGVLYCLDLFIYLAISVVAYVTQLDPSKFCAKRLCENCVLRAMQGKLEETRFTTIEKS